VCDAPRATPALGVHPLPGEAATGQEMAPKPRQNSKQAYFVWCYAWLLGCYAWLLGCYAWLLSVRARFLMGPDITPDATSGPFFTGTKVRLQLGT
jgi:hypothetical protein